MSVASRIASILRSRALSASRTLLERARSGRPFFSRDASSSSEDGGADAGASRESGWHEPGHTDAGHTDNWAHHGHGAQGRPSTQDPNLAAYYANLEVPFGAGREEVEAGWKRQARRYHPDRFASDPERHAVATELLQGINHAYNEICRHLDSQVRS